MKTFIPSMISDTGVTDVSVI